MLQNSIKEGLHFDFKCYANVCIEKIFLWTVFFFSLSNKKSSGFKNFRGSHYSPAALPQFTLIPTHVQYSLLGPLKVHARLGRECLHHFLLLWGEGGHWAGRRCGCRHGKGSLDLIRTGIPHK